MLRGVNGDDLIALSDAELATAYVDLMNALAGASGRDEALHDLVDALDGLGCELLERLSAEAGRAAIVHHWRDDDPDTLLDAIGDLRRRAATWALRDVLSPAPTG
jgi:hypothetical protein